MDILVFAPHPDDAELFCGGTIATSIKQGHKVGIVDMTRGEMSSRGDLATRAKETEMASQILGVDVRVNLGLPDGQINRDSAALSRQHQLASVVGQIRQHQPRIILAPYWQERHPDHEAAAQLIKDAAFFSGVRKFASAPDLPAYTAPSLLFYQLRVAFEPSLIVNTTEVWPQKLAAIKAYSSQVTPVSNVEAFNVSDTKLNTATNRDSDHGFKTLLSSELSLQSIESRDAHYGKMIGVSYGEPLLSLSPIAASDLLTTMESSLANRALIFPNYTRRG